METVPLLLSWGALFVGYFYLVRLHREEYESIALLVVAMLFRLLFVAAMPALSDDFYRFVWDGKLSVAGIDPFLYTPDELMKLPLHYDAGLSDALYKNLNSPGYYSVYPPVMQFVFWVSAKFSSDTLHAVMIMRSVILLSEAGTFIIAYKLLRYLKLDVRNILLYALNPLVVIELTGNLHFEAVMLFFTVLSVYWLYMQRWLLSAIALALAVSTKMLPLLMLPLILKHIGTVKSVKYITAFLIALVLLFLPFVDETLVSHIGNSVGLYFQHFEFNASVYYLIRSLGYWVKGYNIISVAGKVLPLVFLLWYMVYWLRLKNVTGNNLFLSAVKVYLVYYLLALVVHPWYISTLVLLAIFTRTRFAFVWSAVAGLTYITYYVIPYNESLFAVSLEYIILAAVIFYDVRRRAFEPD